MSKVILVAEDEADIRELMKLLLQEEGYQVETAADGAEAVRVAATCAPDVILMDLRMPVMDGFTAVRLLRQQPETRNTKIIAVSAYLADSAWRARAIEAGCDDCVPKPVDYDTLHKLLQRAASRPRPQ